MSLRDELLGVQEQSPRGFTILAPPSWQKFDANDAGREALEKQLKERFRSIGRPDFEAQSRVMARQQWSKLTEIRAFAVYMPMTPTIDGATPMSMITARWDARGDFESDLRARAGHPVEGIDTEIGTVFRWDHDQAGRGELAGLQSRQHNFIFPFPVANPRRGVLVKVAILHPGEDEAGEALAGFSALAETMVETFRWRM